MALQNGSFEEFPIMDDLQCVVGDISTPSSISTVPVPVWHVAHLPDPENSDVV